MLPVYHTLSFNRLLCGKDGLCEDQAKVPVNSRNSSCIMPVRCKSGLIYSGNFIKPVHCFHQSKKNVRDFFSFICSFQEKFYVKQCHKYNLFAGCLS